MSLLSKPPDFQNARGSCQYIRLSVQMFRGFCPQPQSIKNFTCAVYIHRQYYVNVSVCGSYKTTDFEVINYILLILDLGRKKNTNTLHEYLLSLTLSQTVNKLKLFPMLFPASYTNTIKRLCFAFAG
jgi:hypothetical protein